MVRLMEGQGKKQVCINPEVTVRQGRIRTTEQRNGEVGRANPIIGVLFALLFSLGERDVWFQTCRS